MMNRVSIGECCEVLNGFAFKSERYVEQGIRVIRITNVQKGYIEDSDPKFYPIELENELEKHMLREGDLLISLTGNVGRVALLTSDMLPAALNQRVGCLRMKPQSIITKAFLYHLLNSDYFEEKCVFSSKGIAQKNMSTEWLKEYEIPIFSGQEQNEIVDRFDEIDVLIANCNKRLRDLDNIVKSRFVEMFGDEKNSKRYPVVKVQDVADVQVGVVIKPSQYYTDSEHGVRAFRSLNIGEMHINDEDWVYFSEEGQKKNAKSVLRKNDLVIVRSGAPGTACVITDEFDGSNAVDVIIAHPDTEKVNPYYLCAYTNYPHGKHQIEEGTGGAAQQHFNVGRYKEMNLIYPPKVEQDAFDAFLAQTDKSKHCVKNDLLRCLQRQVLNKSYRR